MEIAVISSEYLQRYKSLMMFIKLHKNKEGKFDYYISFNFKGFHLVLELSCHTFSSCLFQSKGKVDLLRSKAFPWKDRYQLLTFENSEYSSLHN